MARESVTGGTGGQGGTGGTGGQGGGQGGEPGGQGGEGSPGGAGGHTPLTGWRRFARHAQTLVGVLLLLLVMTSAILSYRAATDQRQAAERQQVIADCQAEANRQFSEAIAARSQATRGGNDALRELFRAVSVPGATPEQKARAYEEWLAALSKVDKIQAENPLVPENC